MASPTGIDRWAVRAAILAVALGAMPPGARAEPSDPDKAVAQSLFDKGRSLAEAGKFDEACPLFEESQRLDPGGGTQLNLALCYEGQQKLAKAYGLLNDALSAAIHDGRADRRSIAEEHLATVGPRLSMLTIAVPDDARVPELILWLDGAKLSSASAGVPIAVDGGKHQIEATARKFHPFSTDVDVKPERDRVTVTVPRLVPHAEPAPPASASPPVVGRPWLPPPPPAVKKERTPAAWVLGASSLGLLTIGAFTGVFALVRNGQAQDLALAQGCNFERSYCPKGKNPVVAVDKSNEAEALGWTSTVTLGAGLTAFVVALALPKKPVADDHPGKAEVGLVAAPGGLGLAVTF